MRTGHQAPWAGHLVCILIAAAIAGALAQEPAAQGGGEAAPQATPTPASNGGQKLVKNIFFDTDLRQALSDVSAQTGATIIPTQDVQGTISLELKDVPLEEALRLMCLAGGHVFKQISKGVYLVGSADPSSAAFHTLAETEVVELEYLTTDELKSRLPQIYEKYCKFDSSSDQVVVTAPRTLLEEIVAVMRRLDQPMRQIMIEALVVETEAKNLKDFAARGQGRFIAGDSGTGFLTYTDVAQDLLVSILALVEKQEAETKANPSIVTQEGRQAKVEVSTEQYFTIVTGPVSYPYTTLQQIDATISLEITPQIAARSGEVTMKLRPMVADVTGRGANALPIITKRSAETVVRVRDGQVIAIGGLLEELKTSQRRKIPILGDLPLVGPIFRSTSRSNSVREVVIFVVPHLLEEDGSFRGPRLLELGRTRTQQPPELGGTSHKLSSTSDANSQSGRATQRANTERRSERRERPLEEADATVPKNALSWP